MQIFQVSFLVKESLFNFYEYLLFNHRGSCFPIISNMGDFNGDGRGESLLWRTDQELTTLTMKVRRKPRAHNKHQNIAERMKGTSGK